MIRTCDHSYRVPAQPYRKHQEVYAKVGTITVKYQGELDRDFVDYLAGQGIVVKGQRPLVIESADVDDLLQRILGFLSAEEAMVQSISLRRRPGKNRDAA